MAVWEELKIRQLIAVSYTSPDDPSQFPPMSFPMHGRYLERSPPACRGVPKLACRLSINIVVPGPFRPELRQRVPAVTSPNY